MAAAAVIAPRSVLVWVLPVAVATALAVNSWYAVASLVERGRGTDELSGLQSNRQFIDDEASIGAHVYYLNTTTYQVESSRGHFWETWAPVWAAEFWNRSLRGTLNFGLGEASPLEQGTAALDWASGRIAANAPGPWEDSLALTDPRFHLVGTELRREGPFILTRFRQPLRLRSAVEGVDASGYMFSGSALRRASGAVSTRARHFAEPVSARCDLPDGPSGSRGEYTDAREHLLRKAGARRWRPFAQLLDPRPSASVSSRGSLVRSTGEGRFRSGQVASRPRRQAQSVAVVSRRILAMLPAGSRSTAMCSVDQPVARARSKNAAAWRRPGSAISAVTVGATAAVEQGEQRHGVALLVEDVRGENEVERPQLAAEAGLPVENAVSTQAVGRSVLRQRARGPREPSP